MTMQIDTKPVPAAQDGKNPKSPGKSQSDVIKKASLKRSLQTAPAHGRLDTFTMDEIKKLHIGVSYMFDDQLEGIAVNNGMEVFHNSAVPILYEQALKHERSQITSSGALLCKSGEKTGRSPLDKRIVYESTTADDIWWGGINIKISEQVFSINRERAVDYLNTRERVYVVDGYAGWDPKYRIKIRVISTRAYHILFMRNMLITPDPHDDFEKPDYVIYNAGAFPCNRLTEGMTSSTSVSINFQKREMVILGTQYAGEMKKGVFTIMHYLMPKQGLLSLHSSCNQGRQDGDVSLFFGLSGTGKTTLSADPNRLLIGDDEHVWSDDGVFNIEGGCYAKCIGLEREKEPEIYDAIRFGAVLENVVMDEETREPSYEDDFITENTRCSYPLQFIPNAKIPAVATHPSNIILLTCDASGVLPPVSKLNANQTMYWFISGYTSKIPGTEVGVTEATAVFSACFGAPFLVWHPTKYAELLKEKLEKHKANVWLINTGWVGGSAVTSGNLPRGTRCSLKYTRAIIDAIHSGELAKAEYNELPLFCLQVPQSVTGVPSDLLYPRNSWKDKAVYDEQLEMLAKKFIKNFDAYKDKASQELLSGGPML
ncbi:phosphoenolpyruvate carboxykinase [Acrasis kona]|uniref:phosphoenolpyruvate carboxykinase (ATP) n=1 Tax=Acrasis kona TaxID=1008807 RepID=A0AAW2Z2C6_9EUKA